MRSPPLAGCLSIALLAACGSVVESPLDASPDAETTPDALTVGPVQVTVLSPDEQGLPVANTPVVFIEADGTLVANARTDAAGRASADLHADATVTVVWTVGADRTQIATYYGVQPGDDLVAGFSAQDQTAAGTFNVTFPSFGTATSYTVFGPCGSASGTPNVAASLSFQGFCRTATFDAYVIGRDVNGVIVGWATKNGLQFSAGSTTLVASDWHAASTFTASLTNIPAEITDVDISRQSGFRAGVSVSVSGAPSGGGIVLSQIAPGGGTNAFVSTNLGSASTPNARQMIRDRTAGDAFGYNLDVGANLLPTIRTFTFDLPNQTLRQTSVGAGEYDMFLADLTWSRGTSNFEWIVFAPTLTDLALPTLPPDVGPVAPTAADDVNVPIALLIEDDGDGYDSVREHIFDAFRSVLFGDSTSERIRVSTNGF